MFVETYRQARTSFLEIAQSGGAVTKSYALEGYAGKLGERLAVDTAVYGDPSATKALLIISGTHGLEGAPGSAVQRAFMSNLEVLPPDVKLVFVHGLNPWGFSHGSRSDQDNIDLNRNFIDFSAPPRPNPAYAELHPYQCPPVWSDDTIASLSAAAMTCAQQKGWPYLLLGLTAGQYDFPDGLSYGGLKPAWSRGVIEQILAAELGGCTKVGYLEWHSGLGDFGDLQFVCTHEPGSDAHQRVAQWWGPQAVSGKGGAIQTGEGAAPDYSGLLVEAVAVYLPNADVSGAVVEFGTYDNQQVLAGLLMDRWLKFGHDNTSSQSRDQLEARKRELFYPQDQNWRDSVMQQDRYCRFDPLANGVLPNAFQIRPKTRA